MPLRLSWFAFPFLALLKDIFLRWWKTNCRHSALVED
jgi:hypothetical protein